MRRSKIIRDQRSVLNTDAFDQRRFQEIFEMSEGLQRVRDEGELPTMESLLGDVWAALYKMKPEILQEEKEQELGLNRLILGKLLANKHFEKYRRYTTLDAFTSAIYTATFARKLNGWLAEAKKQDGPLAHQLEAVQAREQEVPFEENEASPMEEQEQASEVLNEKLEIALDASGDPVAQAAEESMEETIRIQTGMVSLMGGAKAGKGAAELKKIPLREQLEIADKVALDPKLQEIADWAGNFKEIAHKKQHKEYTNAMEQSGVTLGNDLERLLPAEIGLYTHPVAKVEFLRKYAEGEVMQYDRKKRDDTGKGPIVFCLDQSDSMSGAELQAKGFILALVSIAKRQHRDLCILLFSSEVYRLTYEKGKVTAAGLKKLATTYLGGGTDFSSALEEALDVICESAFERADLLFATDGEDEVAPSFLERFLEKKKEKKFQVLSLVMGESPEATDAFSDRVLHVTDFNDEGSFEFFEI